MRKVLTLAAVAATLASSAFCSSAQAQWGTLKGRIVLEGDAAPAAPILVKKGDVTAKDADVCAAETVLSEKLVVDRQAVDPKERGIANIFIFLSKKPEKIHPEMAKSKDAVIDFDQKGCRFIPHAMVVRTDQLVKVLSDDAIAHNTHSNPIKNDPENFIVTPNNRAGVTMKKFTKSEKLPFRVNCDIHAWMEAYWLVVDHPYATVTDEHGDYQIDNLPVGELEFIIWHEGCGYLEKKFPVTIKAGENKQKTLSYTSERILK